MATDRVVTGKQVIDSLIENGIADYNTRRVIIDIDIQGIPTLYIEKVGTRTLFNIIPAIRDGGYEIVRDDEPESKIDQAIRLTDEWVQEARNDKMTEKQKPSVARMVHFKDTPGDRCIAAIVTQVYVDTSRVNLAVFPPMAHVFNVDGIDQGTPEDENTWHWPERV